MGNKLTFEELNVIFKKWCEETNRSGGVLIGSSVREFLKYLSQKIKDKI